MFMFIFMLSMSFSRPWSEGDVSLGRGEVAPVKGYALGDKVKDFKLKGVDDKTLSLYAYLKSKKAKGVVIVFTCNTCPYAIASEDRLLTFNKRYGAAGYPVVAINPNVSNRDYPGEAFDKMQERAKEKGFNFPYLVDSDQFVARIFGATRTPHVFVAQFDDKQPANLLLRYKGAFDDNPMKAKAVEKRYVEEAVRDLLLNKEVRTTEAKSIGCSIKWVKE